jgi:hypothetical protein
MLSLNSEIADFIQHGVAAAVSACDAVLRPSMARVVGTRVAEAGQRITVLLRREGNAALLRDAQPGKKLAVVFCLPENERAIQIKGTVLAVEAPAADDWPLVVEHRVRFADQIEPKGYERAFSDFYHAADRHELVALSFLPEAVFEQTPGPQAGRCLSGT